MYKKGSERLGPFVIIIIVALVYLLYSSNANKQPISPPNDTRTLEAVIGDTEAVRISVSAGRVVDGSTFYAEGKKVKLNCVQAPASNEAYYLESIQKLQDLVTDKKVDIQWDVTYLDDFDVKHMYVFYNETMINYEMVRYGYAKAIDSAPDNKFCHLMLEAQTLAQNKTLGLWGEQDD